MMNPIVFRGDFFATWIILRTIIFIHVHLFHNLAAKNVNKRR